MVDDQHGLVVHVEAVNDTSDINQFARQIDQANQQLGKPCQTASADAGYADTEELKKIDEQGILVVVPSQRQALHRGEEKPFSKGQFRYDGEKNCYVCPEGKELRYQGTDHRNGRKEYRISNPKICHRCRHFGSCTTAKRGRKIFRLAYEQEKAKFESQYDAFKDIYDRRKTRAELPFGHIKRNLKTPAFMLRGHDGAQAESSLLATCFDLSRMMTILGVTGLIERLRAFVTPALA